VEPSTTFHFGTVPTVQYYQSFGKKSLVSKVYITIEAARRIISVGSYSLVTAYFPGHIECILRVTVSRPLKSASLAR
jgi:hypothetical protein